VQTALRAVFARWGLPQRVRVDNGAPWATWSDLPPALALWWLGLGLQPVWNPPRRPQKNPFVERCHGLVEPWGEPATCPDYATWTQRLAWIAEVQRERYPALQGRSRGAVYPELRQNSRRYTPATEAALFDVRRVHQYLAQGTWPRTVSKIGQITLYGKAYRVGRAWAGATVWFTLDADTVEWVIRDEHGQALRRHPAAQLTPERIVALQVAHPRPLSRRAQERYNLASQAPV
jgi:hypothetical protein